jgi:hypothetical protein
MYKKRSEMMYNIKEMLKNKKVNFVRYRKGELIYVTECGFEFPVPISDTGDGVFKSTDKAMTYMRWVRKQIDVVENLK